MVRPKSENTAKCPQCGAINAKKDGTYKYPSGVRQKFRCSSCLRYFVENPLKVHGIVNKLARPNAHKLIRSESGREFKNMAQLALVAEMSREVVRLKILGRTPILGEVWEKVECDGP